MFSDADIIHSYTRADMQADGELVDVTETGREAGFTIPVGITRSVWMDCVEWSETDNTRKGTGQDQAGRLWDVVYMAHVYARRSPGGNCVQFQVYRVAREGRGVRPRPVSLVIHIGPGDAGEPVITIMQPGEQ